MSSNTAINWLFNDIWCYLFIACFDWKIGAFQQTVVRVYYTLKLSQQTYWYGFSDFYLKIVLKRILLACEEILNKKCEAEGN